MIGLVPLILGHHDTKARMCEQRPPPLTQQLCDEHARVRYYEHGASGCDGTSEVDQSGEFVFGQSGLAQDLLDSLTELRNRTADLVLVTIQRYVEADHTPVLADRHRIMPGQIAGTDTSQVGDSPPGPLLRHLSAPLLCRQISDFAAGVRFGEWPIWCTTVTPGA